MFLFAFIADDDARMINGDEGENKDPQEYGDSGCSAPAALCFAEPCRTVKAYFFERKKHEGNHL